MSFFVIGRNLSTFDAWALLLLYVGSAQIAVLIGFVASGRRRGWWRRKSNATVDQTGVNAGAARGLHRMPWELLYALSALYALLISVAQWIVVSDQHSCSVDADGHKSCDGIVGATSALYIVHLAALAVYVWAHVSHCCDFVAAIVCRVLLGVLSIVQIGLYAGLSSVGAPIVQGAAALIDAFFIYAVVRGNRAMREWRASRQGMLPITHAGVPSAADEQDSMFAPDSILSIGGGDGLGAPRDQIEMRRMAGGPRQPANAPAEHRGRRPGRSAPPSSRSTSIRGGRARGRGRPPPRRQPSRREPSRREIRESRRATPRSGATSLLDLK